jgi:hypothetical protein
MWPAARITRLAVFAAPRLGSIAMSLAPDYILVNLVNSSELPEVRR